MDLQNFINLYNTIMEKYSWKRMFNNYLHPVKGKKPKYVRFSLDTRDGKIFCATFQKSPTEDITFRLDNEEDVRAMYKWLNNSNEGL